MSTNEVNSEYNEHIYLPARYEYCHVPAFNDCTKIVIVITGLVSSVVVGVAIAYLGVEVCSRVSPGFCNLAYYYKREYRLRETPEQEDEDEQSGVSDSSKE